MKKTSTLILGIALLATLGVYFATKTLRKNEHSAEIVQQNTNSPSIKLSSSSKPVSQFSSEERVELDRLYKLRLSPAIDRWKSAYGDRLPDEISQISLTHFHSTLAGGLYTFVNGDITLTISDTKKGTRVFYMMSKSAALMLNSVGKSDQPPDMSLPVNREEIIRMVKSDTGIEFNSHQVEIKPTAAACAIQGGAFVEVGRQMLGDMELMTGTNVSLVVSSNGKIVSYQH